MAPNATAAAHRQRGRHEPEVGLREIEYSIGAVHEGHAHGEQCGEESDHDPTDPGAEGHAEEDELHHHEGEGRGEWSESATKSGESGRCSRHDPLLGRSPARV